MFQTGPLVIQDNKISSEYINSSLNGQGSYIRTLIGYTETEKFVVITTRFYKLEDVANEILNLEIFKEKKVNLMNLYGGPSTAIYSKDYSAINFNETKKLRLVIRVK